MFGADGATWPEAMIFLGVLLTILFLIGIGVASFIELRKTKLVAKQEDYLHQLVRRYEQLAETTLDAQQRWPPTSPSCARARPPSRRSCARSMRGDRRTPLDVLAHREATSTVGAGGHGLRLGAVR
jgi:hypothetical protein